MPKSMKSFACKEVCVKVGIRFFMLVYRVDKFF
ncbi:Uncharacterised protein [Serratia proteamaculans]|nr:Uncharacterised protein [Serratia proteamaculans]